jgi:uncharacterized protein HemX
MLILLVLAAVALLAVAAAVGVGVILLLRPRSPGVGHPNAESAAHGASTAAGYVPPENPYHAPAEHGTATKNKQTTWLIVAAVVAAGLFGLLACAGVGLMFVSTQRQVIQVREDAVRAERRAQQAAEEARQLEDSMPQSSEDTLPP